ncbi:MAG: hypothetical protein ACD_28C00039G0002 [uncultured bacterium]|nr:MAG: hypothetical protein ACD_28C00039G0002 [uncultured bacterium]
MYIVYFDETGDDGYPSFSSRLFVLTSIYLHHQNWKPIFEAFYDFRRAVKENWNIPIKIELHTKAFLLNKKPFRQLGLSEGDRLNLCRSFAKMISTLDMEIINVAVNKTMIDPQSPGRYKDILDVALTYNIQRVENTIKRIEPATKFITITDEGRVGKMQKTTRKIQKINFVPSLYGPTTYRNEIKMMIEDPLPKNSKESFFIQACDFVSFFVYLYLLKDKGIDKWHNRLSWLSMENVREILGLLKPVLNINASRDNDYGFVIYPK